jgi:hypothetical protein
MPMHVVPESSQEEEEEEEEEGAAPAKMPGEEGAPRTNS